MSEQLHEMLAFIFEKEIGLSRAKARSLASHFASLEEFITLTQESLQNIRSISGKKILNLTAKETALILELQSSGFLSVDHSVSENFLSAISRNFTRKQLLMLNNLSLENINPNPFLIRALNLNTPQEVVQLNVYMASTRSIVTSMGFFLQEILLASAETVEIAPKRSGWDLVKITPNGERCWIQVKSGPNSIDRDQIVYWASKIQEKIIEGDRAYIGITYGKRTNQTVTIGLLKQILPDWEMKTLIGRELWDFLCDDPEYSSQLFEILRTSAAQILHNHSISDAIKTCIVKITSEFIHRYGEGELGVHNYISEIF